MFILILWVILFFDKEFDAYIIFDLHEYKSSKFPNSDLTKIDYKHKKEFMGICTVMDMSPTPINVFKNMPCKNTMNDSPINATISKKYLAP